jgi:putative ABC transport system permease protein
LNVHNFRKNYFPLDESKGSMGILLPFKAVFHWGKQSVLLMVMMIAIGFTTAFVIAFGYNAIIDDSRMMRLLSANHENAAVFINDDDIIPEIAAMDEVEKVYRYNSEMSAAIGDYQVTLESTDDYSDFSFDGIYEGRAPKYDNEIVISGNVKKHLEVELGEEIEVSCGAYTEKFLIVGLTQTTSSMGWGGYITEEARINRLHIPLNYTHLCVDLEGVNGKDYADSTDEFINKLKDKFGNNIIGAYNIDRELYVDNSLLNMMKGIVFAFAVLILVFVTLVINLIIKTVTVRRQHEFGIQKAIGFTSRQIRGQLGIETMSVSVVGNIIGAILGCYFTNKIVSLIFSGFGVMKADFLVPVSVGIISVISLAVFIYAITYLVSANIKKISAYKLISE